MEVLKWALKGDVATLSWIHVGRADKSHGYKIQILKLSSWGTGRLGAISFSTHGLTLTVLWEWVLSELEEGDLQSTYSLGLSRVWPLQWQQVEVCFPLPSWSSSPARLPHRTEGSSLLTTLSLLPSTVTPCPPAWGAVRHHKRHPELALRSMENVPQGRRKSTSNCCSIHSRGLYGLLPVSSMGTSFLPWQRHWKNPPRETAGRGHTPLTADS